MTSRRCALLLALANVACQSGDDVSASSTSTTSASEATDTGATTSTTTASAESSTTGTPATSDDTPPTTDAPATTGDASGASSSTGEAATCELAGVYDCCCFSVTGAEGHGVLSVACPNPGSLCEPPQATCPEGQTDCPATDLTITSGESITCVLEALAAATPGVVSWNITSENGLNGSSHSLFIQEDGSVISSSYEYKELAYTYTPVERRALQAGDFFTDCAAAATETERFDCLRQAATGEASETCLDGFSGNAGER